MGAPTLIEMVIAFAPRITSRTEDYATSRGRTDLDKVWIAAALGSVRQLGDAFRSGDRAATEAAAVEVGATALAWLDHLDQSAPKPSWFSQRPATSLRDVAVRMVEEVANNVGRLRAPNMHPTMVWTAALLDVLKRNGEAYEQQVREKYVESVVIYAATALGFVSDLDFRTGRASPQ